MEELRLSRGVAASDRMGGCQEERRRSRGAQCSNEQSCGGGVRSRLSRGAAAVKRGCQEPSFTEEECLYC